MFDRGHSIRGKTRHGQNHVEEEKALSIFPAVIHTGAEGGRDFLASGALEIRAERV